MATSADKDDRDEDETNTAESDAATSKKKTASTPKAEEKKAITAASDDDEDDDDDNDDDEDDGEEEEDDGEEEEDAKPAPKAAASPAKRAAGAKGEASAGPAAKPRLDKGAAASAKRGEGPGARKPVGGKPNPPRQAGSLGKTLILFVVIVGGLATAFAWLGKEETVRSGWAVGQTVDVSITLVPSDATNLNCAMPDELSGRHCAFEAANKPWSKTTTNEDKNVLRPYTTTNGQQFLAAGLWSDQGITGGPLPKGETRFTANCKFRIDGNARKAQVRWRQEDAWYDWSEPHFTGLVAGCTIPP